MTIKITAKTINGDTQTLTASPGESLMDTLRNADLVEATCGGAASCGTCHIFLAAEWTDKVNPQTEDEGYMLESLAEVTETRETSRLSCQLKVTDDLNGLALEIAPEI